MSGDGPKYGGNWSNPWGPMSAPMEQWLSAVRAWADAWSAFMPGGRGGAWPNAWQQPWNMAGMGFPPPPTQVPVPVSVKVSSPFPTEVTATLMPGAEGMPLAVHVPNLSGVSIGREAGKVRVSVHVVASQPAGTYRGKITSNGCDVGELTVAISEPVKAA